MSGKLDLQLATNVLTNTRTIKFCKNLISLLLYCYCPLTHGTTDPEMQCLASLLTPISSFSVLQFQTIGGPDDKLMCYLIPWIKR